jgi:hypothetical protein
MYLRDNMHKEPYSDKLFVYFFIYFASKKILKHPHILNRIVAALQ